MVARTGLFVAPLPGTPPQGTSPTDGRLVLGGLFGTTGGCISGGTMTASATAMTIAIAAAVWRIPDPTNTAGVYLSPADAYTFTLAAGPASGSRIDLLWVKQDNYENGDADSRVTYGITAGTAASSPVAPTLPAGVMQLARVTVGQGISNAAACTVVQSYGGQAQLTPGVTATSVAALPAGIYVGQRGTAGGVEYRWNGTTWRAQTGDGTPYYGDTSSADQSSTLTTLFRRIGNDVVTARININVGANGAAVGGWVATAPAGFFPAQDTTVVVAIWSGPAWVGTAHLQLSATDGRLYLKYASTAVNANFGLFGTLTYPAA